MNIRSRHDTQEHFLILKALSRRVQYVYTPSQLPQPDDHNQGRRERSCLRGLNVLKPRACDSESDSGLVWSIV